jgi:hypothetical protein
MVRSVRVEWTVDSYDDVPFKYLCNLSYVAEHTHSPLILVRIQTNPNWVKIANALESARDLSIYGEFETNRHQIV